eukprot:579657-Hanusia_phi.AAC.1
MMPRRLVQPRRRRRATCNGLPSVPYYPVPYPVRCSLRASLQQSESPGAYRLPPGLRLGGAAADSVTVGPAADRARRGRRTRRAIR